MYSIYQPSLGRIHIFRRHISWSSSSWVRDICRIREWRWNRLERISLKCSRIWKFQIWQFHIQCCRLLPSREGILGANRLSPSNRTLRYQMSDGLYVVCVQTYTRLKKGALTCNEKSEKIWKTFFYIKESVFSSLLFLYTENCLWFREKDIIINTIFVSSRTQDMVNLLFRSSADFLARLTLFTRALGWRILERQTLIGWTPTFIFWWHHFLYDFLLFSGVK